MATDNSRYYAEHLESPARKALVVTPSDSVELAFVSRALYIGGAGDVAVTLADDSVAVTFKAVPVGTLLPIRARLVNVTGTTATNIVAIY